MIDRRRALAVARRVVLFLVLELSLGLLLFLLFLLPQLSRDFQPTPWEWGSIVAFVFLYIFFVYFAFLGPRCQVESKASAIPPEGEGGQRAR